VTGSQSRRPFLCGQTYAHVFSRIPAAAILLLAILLNDATWQQIRPRPLSLPRTLNLVWLSSPALESLFMIWKRFSYLTKPKKQRPLWILRKIFQTRCETDAVIMFFKSEVHNGLQRFVLHSFPKGVWERNCYCQCERTHALCATTR